MHSNIDVDIQAQLHKTHDEKAYVYETKNEVQNPIQDLGGLMTKGRLRKIKKGKLLHVPP